MKNWNWKTKNGIQKQKWKNRIKNKLTNLVEFKIPTPLPLNNNNVKINQIHKKYFHICFACSCDSSPCSKATSTSHWPFSTWVWPQVDYFQPESDLRFTFFNLSLTSGWLFSTWVWPQVDIFQPESDLGISEASGNHVFYGKTYGSERALTNQMEKDHNQ